MSQIPELIGSLRGLRFLNLSENLLISPPDSIGNLKELRELRLDGNTLYALTVVPLAKMSDNSRSPK